MQIDDPETKISVTRKPGPLVQQLQALQGKLALDKATLEAVEKMKAFLEATNYEGSGLEGSINELRNQMAVPEFAQLRG